MKKILGVVLGLTLLTGCTAPTPEVTATPSPSVVTSSASLDIEEEQRLIEESIATREAESLRQAEQKRLDEAARITEIERQQAEANQQLEERLRREYPEMVDPKPLPPKAAPPAPATQAPETNTDGYAWITQMQTKYSAHATAGTKFNITDTLPSSCGADAVGCFTAMQDSATGVWSDKNVWILPSQVGSDPWILFHEIAHSHGIRDECAADEWARQFLPGHMGAYC